MSALIISDPSRSCAMLEVMSWLYCHLVDDFQIITKAMGKTCSKDDQLVQSVLFSC